MTSLRLLLLSCHKTSQTPLSSVTPPLGAFDPRTHSFSPPHPSSRLSTHTVAQPLYCLFLLCTFIFKVSTQDVVSPPLAVTIFLPSGEVWLLLYTGIWTSSLAWAWMSHWYPVLLLLQCHNTVLHLLVLFPASTINFLMTRAFCFAHHPFCNSLPGLPASTL